MPSFKMNPLIVAAAVVAAVKAQDAPVSTFPATPLADKHYAYTDIPYKVDTDTNLLRGTQFGFNQCNSTTQNQDSDCQTSFLNSIDDFCLWAPSKPNSTIADTEGEEVAWCTKPGHGSRVIPPGALQGVQYMRTPDYVQVVGFIDQSFINIQADDYGGELDPHGADLRGNPMGGLMYSTAFGDGNSIEQVIEWHNFMGGSAFCLKLCDPAGQNAADYCQHIYDRIGCAYNAPNNAQNGTFEACKGDNQDFPGVYTATDGSVVTYTQPAESLGAITSMPYTWKVPASSECTTYTSASLYSPAAEYFASSVTGTATAGLSKATSGSGSGSGASASRTGGSLSASSSASASSSDAVRSNGAAAGALIAVMGFVGALAIML